MGLKIYPVSEARNQECDDLMRRLEMAQYELTRRASDAGHKHAAYEEKFNKRIVELVDDPIFKTDKLREAKAKADCAMEFLQYKLADNLMKAASEAVRTWRAQLSAWQTKCGNIKAEAEAAGAS